VTGAATLRIALISIAWIAPGLGAGPAVSAQPAAQPFYIGGIQVNESDHGRWVDTLQEIGMNTVSVTVYARQGAWDSDHLWFADEEPAAVLEIRSARARGLHVVLILRVAVDHAFPENEFVWHGMIMPRNDAMIDSWFARYRTFVEKWARVAQTEGVDVLGIASEMNALTATRPISRWGHEKNFYVWLWYQRTQRRLALQFTDELTRRAATLPGLDRYPDVSAYLDARFDKHARWAGQTYLRRKPRGFERVNERRARINEHWVDLIAGVRRLYDGQLTYAANFDAYTNVGFWSELDLIGINSYFPLRERIDTDRSPGNDEAHFRKSWDEILGRIRRFRDELDLNDKPVVFTELGLTTRRQCTVRPWAHSGFSILRGPAGPELVVWDEQPFHPAEREAALAALVTVYRERHRDLLRGILYWKLSTTAEHATLEPYVVHIGTGSHDRLQEILVRFLR
jgi:hypothetical protein